VSAQQLTNKGGKILRSITTLPSSARAAGFFASRPAAFHLVAGMASSSSAAASAEVKPNTKALLAAIKQLAPPLSLHSHKGQSGRVGVIGGSKAYTGAPYFSAQCCLSMGADLVTLFCSVEAALAIKAYSPDLMVRPTLFPAYKAQEATAELDAAAAGGDGKDKDKGKSLVERLVDDIEQWSAKLDVQVLGPGLGKDELISQTVGAWIVKQSHKGEGSGSSGATEKEKQQPTPLVIDGDGIHVFQHSTAGRATTHASAFNAHVVLTPNAAEFRRLWQHFVGEGEKGAATAAAAMPLPNFDVDADDQWLKDSQLFRTAGACGQHSAVTGSISTCPTFDFVLAWSSFTLSLLLSRCLCMRLGWTADPDGGEISVQHPLARETAHLADVCVHIPVHCGQRLSKPAYANGERQTRTGCIIAHSSCSCGSCMSPFLVWAA
jgi:hydroxyethylthiazole kinase-like uncharacterized protein yjeF